jgi:hypothetical protein
MTSYLRYPYHKCGNTTSIRLLYAGPPEIPYPLTPNRLCISEVFNVYMVCPMIYCILPWLWGICLMLLFDLGVLSPRVKVSIYISNSRRRIGCVALVYPIKPPKDKNNN